MFDYIHLVDELALAIAFDFHAMIVMFEAREMAIESLHRQQIVNDGLVVSAGFERLQLIWRIYVFNRLFVFTIKYSSALIRSHKPSVKNTASLKL